MVRPISRLLPLLPFALVAGCAEQGSYPSLAPRPIEQALRDADEQPPRPPLPDDPALAERLAGFVAQARSGVSGFDKELAAAERAVATAGAPGSESWIAAQQAVSRVEAARAVTTRALGELDSFSVSQANARALSDADLARLAEATAEVQAIATRQSEALNRLQGALRPL